MFGTLRPHHIDTCSQGRYQSNFCGTCHALAEMGRPWALTTGYDITFLHSVMAALEEAEVGVGRCTALPFKELSVRRLSEESRRWLTAFYVLLMREKCRDDLEDDGGLKARMGLRVISSQELEAEKILAASGFSLELLCGLSQRQKLVEERLGLEVEHYAVPTSQLMGEALGFTATLTDRPECEAALRHLGQSLGAVIYLRDAQDDLEKDRKRGRFNAILASEEQNVTAVLSRELRRVFQGLDGLSICADDKALLRSILDGLKPSTPVPRLYRRGSQRGVCELLLCCDGLSMCAGGGEFCAYCCGEAACHGCCLCAESDKGMNLGNPAPTSVKILGCPACSKALEAVTYEGVEVDECPACYGIWLDKGELEYLNERDSQLPVRFFKTHKDTSHLRLRPEGTRPCPHCAQLLVGNIVKGVRLDICTECQGIWLDQGELNQLLGS